MGSVPLVTCSVMSPSTVRYGAVYVIGVHRSLVVDTAVITHAYTPSYE